MALPRLDSPKYDLTIPSTGEKVKFRPYLVKEEKILMMAIESEDTRQMMTAVKDVIRSCTEDAIDIDKLAMFDLEYVFTQLRSKSVGEVSTISVKCKECESKNDVDVDLTKVRVDVPKEKNKTIMLTDSIGVSLRYPSVDTLLNAQADDQKSDVDRVFDVIISSIDSIYSNDTVYDASEQPYDELKEFVESLNTNQFNDIREFIENIPTAAIGVEFKCISCGHDNAFDVKGLGNFFE